MVKIHYLNRYTNAYEICVVRDKMLWFKNIELIKADSNLHRHYFILKKYM